MQTIGFIGLGIMGKPMARNLLKAGYSLVVYDIASGAVQELEAAGARKAGSPKEVAAASEVIITMLPNSPQVREVVQGTNGIMAGVRAGTIFVDMSSIAPQASRELSACLAEKGVLMLDAPVSGGEPKAIEGKLAIMVGGPQKAFDAVKAILAVMGASVTLVGEIGSGNITKLTNQIIVALNIAAVSEGLILAAKAGVSPEKVYEAIRGGLAGSMVMEAKVPMILAGNFKPGFRIELHIKDLMNAVDAADEMGVDIPLSSKVLEMMQTLKAEGKEKHDHSGLVQLYEQQAKVEVRR